MNLVFKMPTKILMDKDCVIKNASAFKDFGKKAIIVTGKSSAKLNGSLDDVLKALEINGQDYVLYDKVMTNPTVDCVYDGAKEANDNNADFLIAIGGGSPMDAGKTIALLACQSIAKEDLFKGNYENKILPMVFIPTTAGTGSEVTTASIITNDEAKTKSAVAAPFMAPTLALLDSKYLKSLSNNTMINTVLDALSHLIEGYINKKDNALISLIALEGIKIISSELNNLKNNTYTDDDLDKLMYASNLAGIVISHTGTTLVHAMGYSLTYFKHIDHGRANGLLMYDYLKYYSFVVGDKIDNILKHMKLNTLLDFKKEMDTLLKTKEDITSSELKEYSKIAINAKNVLNCPFEVTEDDIYKIYSNAFIK
ncbi:MAG: iron-containing alcohol dehydrogenase family protein [Anaeroplasmataceae bacterium]